MFAFKNIIIVLAMAGAAMGKRGRMRGPGGFGGRGGHRGDGPFAPPEDVPLVCAEDEEYVECASPRMEDAAGVLACRTHTPAFEGAETRNKTICVDPDAASANDTCGCCEGACPVECPCDCNGGESYLVQPQRPHRRRGPFDDFQDETEEEVEEDVEEDEGVQVYICAPKTMALTLVATGRATCATECVV